MHMGYSEQIIHGGSALTRFSHRQRYERVLGLMAGLRGARALDFGCGDGWILRQAYDRGIVSFGVGVDSSIPARTECAERFSGADGLSCLPPEELASLVPEASCDVVLCTETLEHVSDPTGLLDTMLRYARPGGELIVTVPIEVGPSLLFKQLGRLLARRAAKSYGFEPYTPRELLSAAVFWDAHSFPSSHLDAQAPVRGHKGFDYRSIEKLLRSRLEVAERIFTPLPVLGPLANSTVMWRCKVSAPRAD